MLSRNFRCLLIGLYDDSITLIIANFSTNQYAEATSLRVQFVVDSISHRKLLTEKVIPKMKTTTEIKY